MLTMKHSLLRKYPKPIKRVGVQKNDHKSFDEPIECCHKGMEWPATSRLDILLSRLSSISQVVIVVVAIFGYIYTVRPIYQKELLSEKIAKSEMLIDGLEISKKQLGDSISKLELEKSAVEIDISEKKDKLASLGKENAELKKSNDALKINERGYKERIYLLQKETLSLEQKHFNLGKKLEEQNKIAKAFYIDKYIEHLSMRTPIPYLNAAIASYSDRSSDEFESIKSSDIHPYDVICNVIETEDMHDFKNTNQIPISIKRHVLNFARKKLIKEKIKLSSSLDLDFVRKLINKKIKEIQSIPDSLSKDEKISEEHKINSKYINELHKTTSASTSDNLERTMNFFLNLKVY